jgi:hypothetical protein
MATIPSYLVPADEPARLHSLRHYDVVHSLRDTVFYELVALTARIFSLPVSLIALVEEEEVQYAANFGMPGNDVQPRDEALCSTAILHDKAVVYKDLAIENDPFITPRAAQAAHNNQLRFYAAAPLCMPDQQNIGALCVIDYNPRVFSLNEQHILERLAALVSKIIVVRCNCRSLPEAGATQWQSISAQLREEVQGLTALVRYMLTRYGTQIPVATDMLMQVERRLHDLDDILDQLQG